MVLHLIQTDISFCFGGLIELLFQVHVYGVLPELELLGFGAVVYVEAYVVGLVVGFVGKAVGVEELEEFVWAGGLAGLGGVEFGEVVLGLGFEYHELALLDVFYVFVIG